MTGLLATGTTFGSYTITGFINKGGMAEVYKAIDNGLGIDVALKVLYPRFSQDNEFVSRFQREANAAAILSHPNIMRVYAAGKGENGQSFIAMEYIRGGTLEDRLIQLGQSQQLLNSRLILTLIRQIADALDCAHRAGIVHRDLKPSNILMREDNTPVLSDLGIAFMQNDSRLTQTSSMVGTPDYMSPEQATNKELDGRSDIYSLGILLYELFAGSRPFTGDNPWTIIHHHMNTPPTPLNQVRKGLAKKIYQIVDKCLQKDPNKRYQTASELVKEFDALLAADSQYISPHGTNSTISWTDARIREIPVTQNRNRGLWISLGLISTLLLGVIGYLVFAGIGSGQPPIRITAPPPSSPVPEVAVIDTATPVIIIATSTISSGSNEEQASAETAELSGATEADLTEQITPTETKVESTATPVPTEAEEPTLTPSAILTEAPLENPAGVQIGDGIPIRFENNDKWGIGNEKNGTLKTSQERAKVGEAAGRLDYQFNSSDNDYVVFLQRNAAPGRPTSISAWVYGDGSGHFVNVWIQDANNDVWQVPMGQVFQTGWSLMTGYIDTSQEWPWTHISGPDNKQVDYPINFYALVLDDFNSAYKGSGTIFIDEIQTGTLTLDNQAPPDSPTQAPSDSPTQVAEEQSPTEEPETFEGDLGRIIYTSGNNLLTTDPSWSTAKELGTASSTSCSGAPTLINGQSFRVYSGYFCSLSGPTKCTSPNGAKELIINIQENMMTINIRNTGEEGNGDFIYEGSVEQAERIQWSPDSQSFIWVVNDTVHRGFARGGYEQLFFPVYNPVIGPDSQSVLFRRPVGPGVNDVWVAQLDTKAEKNVTNNLAIDKNCAVWAIQN